MKTLPILNCRKLTPDFAAPSTRTAKALHDIWENSRQWHLDGQDSRDPQHGHMLRALLLAAATLAGVWDETESTGDAEVAAIMSAAEAGTDNPGHAGTHMMHARTLMYIMEFDTDASKFLNKNIKILERIAKESEGFYQSDTDFLSDLRGGAVRHGDQNRWVCQQ
jgi:hypothetical protein